MHGYFLIEIRSARNLPDMDSWIAKLVDKRNVTDAYVDVSIGKAKIIKTSVIDNDLNPVWNESYRIEACHFASHLTFAVKDKDHAYSEYIGSVEISSSALLSGEIKEGWFPIYKSNKQPYPEAKLHIRMEFVPRNTLMPTYEVDCYFPMRKNCLVTLYQDAHALDIQQMPHFNMMNPPHQPRSCWKDLYYAFVEAKHIICITGWSVWPMLQLFRGVDQAIDERTLGQLLIDKSNEGVKVYVMIWDESIAPLVFRSSSK